MTSSGAGTLDHAAGRRARAAAWLSLTGSAIPVGLLGAMIVYDETDHSDRWDGLGTYFASALLVPALVLSALSLTGVLLVTSALRRGLRKRLRRGGGVTFVVAVIQVGASLAGFVFRSVETTGAVWFALLLGGLPAVSLGLLLTSATGHFWSGPRAAGDQK